MTTRTNNYKYIFHCCKELWGWEIYIMEKKGRAFGRVYGYRDDKSTAYLAGLSVRESARRQGIGTDLQVLREAIAIGCGAKTSCLWVEKGTWMHEWYKRRGYKDLKDHEDQENNVWMEKELKDEELKDEPLHLQSLVNEVAKHNNPGSIEPCAESIAGMPKSRFAFCLTAYTSTNGCYNLQNKEIT